MFAVSFICAKIFGLSLDLKELEVWKRAKSINKYIPTINKYHGVGTKYVRVLQRQEGQLLFGGTEEIIETPLKI